MYLEAMGEKLHQASAARIVVKHVIVIRNASPILASIIYIFKNMFLKFGKPHIKAMTFNLLVVHSNKDIIGKISFERFLCRQ